MSKKLSFFDPEHVEREVPERPWKTLAIVALVALAAMTALWEAYWRTKGFSAGDFKNSDGLWAEQRRKAKDDATVMIGSSRIFFDIDLDIWEELSGERPIQLALEGTSPRVFLTDLADDQDFKGLVIVGVTAPIFFTRDGGLRADALGYVRDETLSERADHVLSMQLERVFAFLDEQTRPKRQIEIWPLPLREGMKPLFSPRKLSSLRADRNTRMWERVETDEVYRNEARRMWEVGTAAVAPPPGPDGKPPEMPDEAINAVIAEVKANVEKIRAKGGDVAFMRLPFTGAYNFEDVAFPRARFWDRLIAETGAVGVTFQDHPELQGYTLPEWSHLSASEAERYTRAVVPIFYSEINKKAD